MTLINGKIVGFMALIALTACAAQHEEREQHEAAQYHVQQHDSAFCANQGLLPGSDEFNACLDRLEGTQPKSP